MKYLFQNKKLILKKSFLKKLLGFLIFIIFGLLFFAKNNVSAQALSQNTGTPTNNTLNTQGSDPNEHIKKMSEINVFFTYISRTIYALLWPVLFVAGIALDNRLVYGSFLHLDASLWTLWNIMKNFANFALGFMVLFAIVKNIFTAPFSTSGDKWGPVNIIKKTLIAGILIQMSWFLMAAIIDVSTILTYSIGGLPMTVLQNNPKTSNMPIIGINATLSTKGDNKMDLRYYNTYGDVKMSPCYTLSKIPGLTGDYIVGSKEVKLNDDEYFSSKYCTLGSWPYKYKENPAFSGYKGDNENYLKYVNSYFAQTASTGTASTGTATTVTGATGTGNTSTGATGTSTTATSSSIYHGLLDDCYIIPTDFSKISSGCNSYGILHNSDPFFAEQKNSSNIAYTIDNLLDKSKGFVGPFITIYSSLLDFSALSNTDSTDFIIEDFFELVIKLFFAVILFFPLLALAGVLILRVGILWLAIAISPIIVLLKVFDGVFKLGSGSDGFMKYFDIKNLITLIFAPVFVVFAISMSMIFLSALNPRDIKKDPGFDKQQLSELGIEVVKNNTYSILGLAEIELDFKQLNKGKNTFSWFITMLFSTGVVWFFLFFAIRMTKVGETVGKGLQESIQKLAANLPIIPIAGGIGVSAAGEGLRAASDRIPTALNTKQMQFLREKYPWLYGPAAENADRGEKADGFHGMSTGLQHKVHEGIAAGKTFETIFTDNKSAFIAAGFTNSTMVENSYNVVNNYAETIKSAQDDAKVNTFQAEIYTSESISLWSNQSKSKRHDWAKGAVGSNVKTSDGNFVVVNVGTHGSPQFKLITGDQYKDYIGAEPDKIKDKLKIELEKNYTDQNKPDNVSEETWKDEKEEWIDKQIKLHMENAEKRLNTNNSGGDTNNSANSQADQTSTASGGSDNVDSDIEE